MGTSDIPIKPNWRKSAKFRKDTRSAERIFAHYQIEVGLALELMKADQSARRVLYGRLYDRLFASLGDHPQKTCPNRSDSVINRQVALLKKLIPKGARFAELGAGDCKISLGLCDHCIEVTAIEVSDTFQPPGRKPSNFKFVKIDGVHLPFPDGSFDFVFSDQLMEHLHPEDAIDQLSEIARILEPGGAYYCITPNVITGPHDISLYFDNTARAFHLKEYSYRELSDAFKRVGLRTQFVLYGRGKIHQLMPAKVALALEKVTQWLWAAPRSKPSLSRVFLHLMGIRMLAYKR